MLEKSEGKIIAPNDVLNDICKRSVEAYGIDFQLRLLQEECGECVAAVNRYFRGRDNSRKEIISEIADVLIMAIQGLNIFGPEVEVEIDKKLSRLESRLETHRIQLKKLADDRFFDVDGMNDGG